MGELAPDSSAGVQGQGMQQHLRPRSASLEHTCRGAKYQGSMGPPIPVEELAACRPSSAVAWPISQPPSGWELAGPILRRQARAGRAPVAGSPPVGVLKNSARGAGPCPRRPEPTARCTGVTRAQAKQLAVRPGPPAWAPRLAAGGRRPARPVGKEPSLRPARPRWPVSAPINWPNWGSWRWLRACKSSSDPGPPA